MESKYRKALIILQHRLKNSIPIFRSTKENGSIDTKAWFITNFTKEQYELNLFECQKVIEKVLTDSIEDDEVYIKAMTSEPPQFSRKRMD